MFRPSRQNCKITTLEECVFVEHDIWLFCRLGYSIVLGLIYAFMSFSQHIQECIILYRMMRLKEIALYLFIRHSSCTPDKNSLKECIFIMFWKSQITFSQNAVILYPAVKMAAVLKGDDLGNFVQLYNHQ